MRKTLLMAAAALAACVISIQAQVYSQNVVGYYNLPMNATYNLVSVQFNVGASNGASEILPNIPDGTSVWHWNYTTAGFAINYFDTGGGSSAPVDSWYMSDYSTPTNAPIFPPGTSIFVIPTSAVTNTIVGTVPSAITNNLVAGYNMAASALPVGGYTTNGLFNLNGLPDGTATYQWDQSNIKYLINYYDTGGGSTTPVNSWYMSDYSTQTNPPNLFVGQGLFLVPPSTYQYSQTFTNQ